MQPVPSSNVDTTSVASSNANTTAALITLHATLAAMKDLLPEKAEAVDRKARDADDVEASTTSMEHNGVTAP